MCTERKRRREGERLGELLLRSVLLYIILLPRRQMVVPTKARAEKGRLGSDDSEGGSKGRGDNVVYPNWNSSGWHILNQRAADPGRMKHRSTGTRKQGSTRTHCNQLWRFHVRSRSLTNLMSFSGGVNIHGCHGYIDSHSSSQKSPWQHSVFCGAPGQTLFIFTGILHQC